MQLANGCAEHESNHTISAMVNVNYKQSKLCQLNIVYYNLWSKRNTESTKLRQRDVLYSPQNNVRMVSPLSLSLLNAFKRMLVNNLDNMVPQLSILQYVCTVYCWEERCGRAGERQGVEKINGWEDARSTPVAIEHILMYSFRACCCYTTAVITSPLPRK